MSSHYHLLCKNAHHNSHLQNAWNKYGEDAFEFEVVEKCSKDKLLEREQYWIDYYHVYDNQYGYNICRTAGNTSGRQFSEETKNKIRKARLGVKMSEPMKAKIRARMSGVGNIMYGRHHTEESKQKMREHSPDYNGESNPFF